MANFDNIVDFSRRDRTPAHGSAGLQAIAACRDVVERTLPKLMAGLFEKLDDTLYELADKSESNRLQTAYFDAMRAVRRRRERIHNDFVEGVLGDYDRLWTDGPTDLSLQQAEPEPDDAGLELVDDEELEQTLAVNNLVSKGENRYQRELFGLGRRFSLMLGVEELNNNANPVGPAAICNRFHQTIRGLAVDTPVLLVIYKLFDKQVMNYAGGLYEELNSLLGRAGFEPKNRPPPRARSGPRQVPARSAPGQQPGAPGERGTEVGRPAPTAYGPGAHAAPGQFYAPTGYAQAPGGPNRPATDAGISVGQDADADAAAHTPVPGVAHTGAVPGVGFGVLQDLLAGYRDGRAGPASGSAESLPLVATPELIGVLSALQRVALDSAPEVAAAEEQPGVLREQLNNALDLQRDGKALRSLDKSDDDTIDVISMLFEFLLGDPNLPDPMKALIARLQIPMLKVALMDKEFFSRALHPARRLLNTLARAALSWSDDGDRSENSLYGRIDSVVKRVIAGFEDDPSLFDALNEEFSAYLERERRVAEIAEERTNQVTRGREQLRVAKQVVAGEISERLARYPRVPLVARTLLEQAWKDVLLLAYLRQGPDSEAWKDGLAIADRLLQSVVPRAGYAERQQLLRTIPELLRSLREGLNGISYDQHRMARLLKELQSCHIACLRGAQTRVGGGSLPDNFYDVADETADAADSDGAAPMPEIAEDEDAAMREAAVEDGGAIRHDEYTDRAEALAVGTWLDMRQEAGGTARIKLSWKSDISDAYVFVNRKGAKVLELTMTGVAKLFRNGTARVLQQVDTPIMDKAMGAMIDTLKGGQAANA